MKKILFAALCLLGCAITQAQVTTNPSVVPLGYTGEIKVTFDPSQGNGGMKGTSQCYVHTGVLMNASRTGDWSHVIGSWRGATQPKLTADGSMWVLTIPSIKSFYGLTDEELAKVQALAFVFHDGPGGSKEGKAMGGQNIIVYLGEAPCADIWAGFTPATVTTKARPSGVVNGIYYGEDGTSVTLCTYAASKTAAAKHVYLLGDMTDWKLDNKYQLYKDGNYFWITLTGLTKEKEYRYQYVVERADGQKVYLSDLFSEKLIHPDDIYEPKTVDPSLIDYPKCGADGGYVSVIQPGKKAYKWSEATLNFKRPNKNNLVIYELWVYDYTTKRSFPGLMERLDYIQKLGVNAIELMPVCEFEGQISWGYNPTHYFAPDKAYGNSEMYKQLIDECHKRGMAVIMDMVFNHATGQNPMLKLYVNNENELKSNPWCVYPAPHTGGEGSLDWNHDFAPAQDMFCRSLQYWLTEYKVDGFRMDLSHGFYGSSGTSTLKANILRMQSAIQSVSPDAYFIQEYWGSSPSAGELISLGMLCWTGAGLSNAYSQLAMGWLKDGDGIGDANRDGYVSYAESHDEERNYYKAKTWGNGDVKTSESVRLKRVPLTMAFCMLLNGPQMLYQFGELGYDYSINSKAGSSTISSDNRCSPKTNPQSMGWLVPGSTRMKVYDQVAKIINLRTHGMPSVFEGNPTAASLNGGQKLRTVQWGSNVFVAGNFDVSENVTATIPSGTWYDYLQNNARVNDNTKTLAPGDLLILVSQPYSDIEEVQEKTVSKVIKTIENGHIYILNGTQRYSITGQRLR